MTVLSSQELKRVYRIPERGDLSQREFELALIERHVVVAKERAFLFGQADKHIQELMSLTTALRATLSSMRGSEDALALIEDELHKMGAAEVCPSLEIAE